MHWKYKGGPLPSNVQQYRNLDGGIEIKIINMGEGNVGQYTFEYHDEMNHYVLFEKAVLSLYNVQPTERETRVSTCELGRCEC